MSTNRHTILGEEYLLSQMPEDLNTKFCIIDCTYGKGLHSSLLLDKYINLKIIAFDYDINNLNINNSYGSRLILIHDNFTKVSSYIIQNKVEVDFILLDLGIHMDQIFNSKYGLSFSDHMSSIDMRVNNAEEIKCAKTILKQYDIKKLTKIFKFYGNLSSASKIASNIIEYRKKYSIDKVCDIYTASGIKINDKYNISKLFQAIRIEVNKEIENLILFILLLAGCFIKKNQNIRLITFTFHSLEDKIIKNFIQHKPINNGLEDMCNSLHILNNKVAAHPTSIICQQSTKKIYKGDINRRKDLFFIIRNTLMVKE